MVIAVGGVATSIGIVINVAREVVQLVSTAQRNRDRCGFLGEQVQTLTALLEELQKQWTPDKVTNILLQNLDGALKEARSLVESCQKKRTLSHVFKTQKKAKKLDTVRERISGSLAALNLANMTLIVSMNKECFFRKVIEKLLDHNACSLLLEREKEEIRSTIKNLTNMENMSSEAETLVKRIIMDIGEGPRGESSWPERPGGGDEAHEVLTIADSIVQEASELRHNRKEIQQLVQFVQQVAGIMRNPETPEQLWKDPGVGTTVNKLKEDLNKALRIVSHNEQHRGNVKITHAAFTCVPYSFEQPAEILKIAYKIEYYVYVLPVIVTRLMSCA